MIWQRLTLRARIVVLVCAMASAALAGGIVTIAYMMWLGSVLTSISETDISAMKIARQLEVSLVMQKGLTTYFFQDRNPKWIEMLEEQRASFERWLQRAGEIASDERKKALVDEIAGRYHRYDESRKEVIRLYGEKRDQEGITLHRQIREEFLHIKELCERFSRLHEEHMEESRAKIAQRADFINDLAMATLPAVVLMASALGYILIRQVLEPIRQLASETPGDVDRVEPNEVRALTRKVMGLIEDVDRTKLELEQSQEQLLRSERLAMVGKLAAGVAHSIRNPLTSVKLRLFSLQKGLNLTEAQREDMAVVSEEIRQIEHIVQNFLEFSRPPKLKLEWISPSAVSPKAVDLIRERFRGQGIEVSLEREAPLPETWMDPERLKEALVNLMVNSGEAMGARGGKIILREKLETGDQGVVLVLEVQDNGPGIPESIRERVFQPFFSTKEEGTGLGLSIVARIVEEHGGWVELRSREGEGTIFSVKIPQRREPWEPS